MSVRHDVDIQVAPIYEDRVDRGQLARVVQVALEEAELSDEMTVSVVITDDQQIRELNRDYRGVDCPTDVLAFPGELSASFVVPEGSSSYLGDVIVSYPTALAQAGEVGHSVERELTILVIHGCLHLLGYDDTTEEERREMWARQEEILRQLE